MGLTRVRDWLERGGKLLGGVDTDTATPARGARGEHPAAAPWQLGAHVCEAAKKSHRPRRRHRCQVQQLR